MNDLPVWFHGFANLDCVFSTSGLNKNICFWNRFQFWWQGQRRLFEYVNGKQFKFSRRIPTPDGPSSSLCRQTQCRLQSSTVFGNHCLSYGNGKQAAYPKNQGAYLNIQWLKLFEMDWCQMLVKSFTQRVALYSMLYNENKTPLLLSHKKVLPLMCPKRPSLR